MKKKQSRNTAGQQPGTGIKRRQGNNVDGRMAQKEGTPRRSIPEEEMADFSPKEIDQVSRPKNLPDKILSYAVLIVIIAAGVAYFQTLFFDYIQLDDDYFRFDNPETKEIVTDFGKAITTGYMYSTYYRPVVNLSFTLDALIYDKNAFSHHFLNLILHIINSYLVLRLLRKLGFKENAALVGSLIFALHPIMTNAVVWIVGRNDLLVGMFGILSFLLLLEYRERRRPLILAFHLSALILAILSKESALLLPFIMGSFLLMKEGKQNFFSKNKALVAAWVVLIGLFPLTKVILKTGMIDYYFHLSNILITYKTIPEIISKLFIPVNIDGLPTFKDFTTISGLLLILLSVIAFIFRRKNTDYRMALLGVSWFLVLELPSMFIHFNNINKEDYLFCRVYLPLIGLIIFYLTLIPSGFFNIRKKIPAAILSLVFVALFVLTVKESGIYRDPVTFWQSAVKSNPAKSSFNRRLGFAYALFNKEYNKALDYAYTALKLNPADGVAWLDIGYYYSMLKEPAKAIEASKNALSIDPDLTIGYKTIFNEALKLRDTSTAFQYGTEYAMRSKKFDPRISGFINSVSSGRAKGGE